MKSYRSVGLKVPPGIVCDLPGMAIEINKYSGVSAPEGNCPPTGDRRPRVRCLTEDTVNFIGRGCVVCQGDSAPTAVVVDTAIFGQLASSPESDDHPTRLEKDDFAIGRFANPPHCLVERPCSSDVDNSESYERETWFHWFSFSDCRRPCSFFAHRNAVDLRSQ